MGVAVINTMLREIKVSEFEDNEQMTNFEVKERRKTRLKRSDAVDPEWSERVSVQQPEQTDGQVGVDHQPL